MARPARRATALAAGDLAPFHADVDFGKLADGHATTTSGVPRTGALNRILASRFEPGQGVDFDAASAATLARRCEGELLGRLQPYALYVPEKAPPAARYGLHAAAALARRQLQPVLAAAATSRSSATAARARS